MKSTPMHCLSITKPDTDFFILIVVTLKLKEYAAKLKTLTVSY